MKPIYASYYIKCRDKLDATPEEEYRLYGDDTMYTFMQELCLHLSMLAPQRLVELYNVQYESIGMPSEVYYGGEEISIDDCGTYYKIKNASRYILKDTPNGIEWEYSGEECE